MARRRVYRVPSMEDIAAIPPNGFKVASTFSGGGGSCLGYRMAGYEVLWASEFVEAARDTYKANFPTTTVDDRDIRDVTADDVLAALNMRPGELDVFDGSPPCSGFSMAGNREKSWGAAKSYSDTSQVVDDLFFEYARLVKGIQPKVFIAENVPGLIIGNAKGYFKAIMVKLRAAGYNVKAAVLNAQWLGVPQARRRLIFVGVREDLGVAPAFPAPHNHFFSIRDALPHLAGQLKFDSGFSSGTCLPLDSPMPTVMAGGVGGSGWTQLRVNTGSGARSIDLPSPTVMSHNRPHTHNEISLTAPVQPIDGAGYSFDPDEHAPTLNSDPSPTERRITIPELRRICSFPDDFILEGTYSKQWERMGRAVPPVMMREIAATVRDKVLSCVG